MKRSSFVRFVIGLSLVFSASAFAQKLDVNQIKVNGYDVYLVNTHEGNGVAFTVNVQTGSWHDEPIRHAGRAHLWEHVIHGGTTKYPGHSTIWKVNGDLGASYNAYTSDDRTFYHYYVHPESLPKAASVLGAMVSTPEWNPETFIKEKSTVKNEAKEYQMQDARAFESSMYLYLAPNHPLAMYDVGTQAQLDDMNLVDLKELFYSNYVPGPLQVIVAGNFDTQADGTTPVTVDQIRKLVAENFIAPNANLDPDMKGIELSKPNRQKVFPSLITSSQARELEIGTSTESRTLKLLFEMDSTVNSYELETLTDYLNLRNQGSLVEYLKNKGWITGMGVSPGSVNNLSIVQAVFQLTAEGAKNRKEIPKIFFALLHDIRENGMDLKMLSYLKNRNIYSYQQSVETAEAAAEYLSKNLIEDPSGKNAFNFKKKYGHVTQDQIKAMIDQAFSIDRMLVGYMGPEVMYPSSDAIFNRPYAVIDNSKYRSTLKRVLTTGLKDVTASIKPQLDPVELRFSNAPKGTGTAEPRYLMKDDARTIAIQENHHTTKGAMALSMKTPLLSIEEEVALSFFASGFTQRNAGKLDFIQSYGIQIGISPGAGISITASGDAEAAKSAVEWAKNGLKDYAINAQEAQRIMAQMAAMQARAQATFTANVATKAAQTLINASRYDSDDLFEVAKKLSGDTNKINAIAKKALTQVDLALVAYGDYSAAELQGLMNELAKDYPTPRTLEQREAVKNVAFKFDRDIHYWKGLDASKDDHAFGRARVFLGPAVKTRESAAMSVMSDLLYSKTFSINRIRNELGYVHGASVSRVGDEQRIMFYGQYEGVERAKILEAGWEEVLQMVKDGTLSDDGYIAAKTGILRQMTLLPESFGERLAQLIQGVNNDDFASREKSIEMIKSLTAEEIDATGKKYLINKPSLTVYASKSMSDIDCNGVMHTRPSDIR